VMFPTVAHPFEPGQLVWLSESTDNLNLQYLSKFKPAFLGLFRNKTLATGASLQPTTPTPSST
jgi:hypothetical protein